MIKAFHHVAMIVSSEKTLDFYKLLGFTETFRKNREYDTAVLMDGYGMQLEIFIDDRHPNRSNSTETTGLRHLALKVDSLEDEMDRLTNISNGAITFSPIMNDWNGIRFVFISDPDGAVIELHE